MVVTSAVAFPTWDGALRAYADALAAGGLWVQAAEFGLRAEAAGPLDTADRLELAWRLLRAGRVEESARRLDGLVDDAHPILPMLRATVLAVRDRAASSLARLVELTGSQPATPLGLRMVVIAAGAVGDRGTELDAAARFLATVNAEDPQMRQLMAAPQATAGDLTAALASAEVAEAGQPADPGRAVREIVGQIRSTGRDEVACRLLAEGCHRSSRPVYGDLLAQLLPWRVRNRNRIVGAGLVVLLGCIGLAMAVDNRVVQNGLLVGVLIGLLMISGPALLRVRRTSFRATNRIYHGYTRSRSRRGIFDVALPSAFAAALIFAFAVVTVRGPTGAVRPSTGLWVAAGSATVGVVLALVGRRLRRRRQHAAAPTPAPVDQCRCWETTLIAGPLWQQYLTQHLAQLAHDDSGGAVLRRCPTTDTFWLHLPARQVAVAVQLPAEPGPELPTGLYL